MNTTPFYFFLLLFTCTFAGIKSQEMSEPKAKKIPQKLEIHGDVRIDNYFWMNQRDQPEVLDYLNEENAYTKAMMKDTEKFQEELFEEMKSRIKEDDTSVPTLKNTYWYQTQFIKGGEYPIYKRWKDDGKQQEEIVFDVNEMAKGYEYFNLGSYSVSPNNEMAVFGVDTLSRRIYTLQVKNLTTGELYPDLIENTTGSAVWASDNQTFFYTRKDDALRPYQIWKHILGNDPKEDELVYEEKDETFNVYVNKTKSKEYIIIHSGATVSDECRFIPADQPNAEWKLIQPRERDLEYSVDHYGDHFYIRTNADKSTNFKLIKTPVNQTEKENWKDVIPHDPDTYFEGAEIFKDFLVLNQKRNAQNLMKVYHWDENGTFLNTYYIPFKEEACTVSPSGNVEFNTSKLRYVYTSMTTPSSVMEFDMQSQENTILKEQEVLGSFDKDNYISERIWVKARDGVKVPVSLVRRKDVKPSASSPLMVYGYGSYGYSMDPYFSSVRLSLLDRGFIYVIAHIRGGEEMGRQWYDNGKLLHKKNTFNDFVDVTQYFHSQGISSPKHTYAMGGSAGGLLMGAVLNQAPELYHGVIAQVPFVDVVSTMLDDSIPLTTGEYDEWGNPNNEEYYHYIKSYSPYDNVEAKNYPNILVTTGYHDSQVQYWEPAKWVAKLRELKTDNNLLLFDCNMDSGHSGASGRFQSLKEYALEYAFLLKLEGIKK